MEKTNEICYYGQVKWFDEKKGFGFITLVNDIKNLCPAKIDESNIECQDIFIHYTNIINSVHYKMLIAGEIVFFNTKNSDNKGLSAVNVRSMPGCELLYDYINNKYYK